MFAFQLKNALKNNGSIKEKPERGFFFLCVDQIPHKSLGSFINVSQINLKLCDIVIAKKNMLTLLIMIYMIKPKSKSRIYMYIQ